VRRSALECAESLAERTDSEREVATRMGVSRTTLRAWSEHDLSGARPRPRGRPPQRAERPVRREILGVLDAEGTGLGIPELQRRFPSIARRELEELRARRAYVLRRRGSSGLHTLTWTRPGSVWAGDFTNTPCRVDGEHAKLQLVRDLASYEQLLATPSPGERKEEVTAALERLFAEHGAPLVVKLDNGSGFIADDTYKLCTEHGVLILFSPPYTPSYNGSCEAGVGSVKNRAARIAAAHGRASAWTSDDVEAARLQANACVRVGGRCGPSPDELWAARRRIGDDERERFLAVYRRHEAAAIAELRVEQKLPLPRHVRAMIDRRAIPQALVELGYLEVRRC